MKRYIRTKDGKIFDTQYEPKAFKYNWKNTKFIIDDNNLIIYDAVFKDRIANHGQILKQADTIEELCDEFVIDKFGEKDVYKELTIGLIQKHLVRNHIIYGAVWSEKGLIYVAKYNYKGELELI